MKKIPNTFDWYPRDFWYWPEDDEKLLLVNDWVHDLDQVLPLIPEKRVCIQAGGACGVWPIYLSSFFNNVISYEACYENYLCFGKNSIPGRSVTPICMGLSDKEEILSLKRDFSESKNYGAGYLRHALTEESVLCSSIDIGFFGKSNVDFICLDIEGYEEKALRGAAQTIERCKPVIMIEEKPLPHLAPGEHLKAREYLESLGYKEALKVHRDVVFIPC